jgi:nucleotide-binding universal stress UspA family protein
MKILLAVDGSEYTQKMLDFVVRHPTLFDPSHEYVIFTSVYALPPHASAAVGSDIVREYHQEEAEKVLKPALATLTQAGLPATTAWRARPVAEDIAAFATEGNFDLLLMGSHGHGSLMRLVMGSVTAKVLANCTVPVLLIR